MSIDSVYGLLFCFDVWNIIFCFYQQITHDARLIFLIPGSSTLQHHTHLTVAAAPDSVFSVDRHHIGRSCFGDRRYGHLSLVCMVWREFGGLNLDQWVLGNSQESISDQFRCSMDAPEAQY